MKVNDKVVYFFNKFFYDLLKDLNNIENEKLSIYISNCKVKNLETTKNIKILYSGLTDELIKLIVSTPVEGFFKLTELDNLFILKDLNVTQVHKNVPETYHNTLKHYIYCLTLMCLIYKDSCNEENEEDSLVLFNNVIDCIRKIQSKEDYSDILESIYDKDINNLIKYVDECRPDDEKQNVEIPIDIPDSLENSTIGNLAKEISEEINLSDFSIEKPDDIMKLMSGNIIGKVGEKIQKKMASGEIKHEQLLSEAMSMLGKMGGSSDIFNNPMIKQMMNSKNFKVDESKIKNMATRDRLKKKLDKKL